MFMRWNFGNKNGGFSSISHNSQKNNFLLSKSKSKFVKINDVKQSTPKLVESEKKETFFENLDAFFYNCNSNDTNENANANLNAYYLPTVGVTNLKLCEPNEVIANQATIFFRILDAFKIPHALFAGSSIGLLRSGKTLPFVDDYDIIIFNKHVPLLINAAPVLKKHGFKIIQNVNPQTNQKNGGCSIYSYVLQKYYNDSDNFDSDDDGSESIVKKSYFLCDVFFSYFDSGGFLRNNASWGLYHGKNIHMKEVIPFQRHAFDGLYLPFFKNVASEVYKCYGDIESCIVESHSLNVRAFYRSWKTAHAEFERIKQCAKDNTMKTIFQNQNNQDENNCNKEEEEDISGKVTKRTNTMNIMDNAFSNNSLDILRDIHKNKMKTIYSFSMEFIIRHAACVKYYFPMIQIEYFSYSRDNQVVMFLNYVDVLHVYNTTIRDFYSDPRIIYLKKPRIDIITVVTFGAFSSGSSKDFTILTECAKYSENICVGLYGLSVGSDALEPFENRVNNVKNCCKFVKRVWKHDDSSEFKYRCMKTCGANIVVTTGDGDFELENMINHSCCVICVRLNDKRNDNQAMNVKFNNSKNVHF